MVCPRGEVIIFSADAQSFGSELSKMETGRQKSGLCVSHVRPSLNPYVGRGLIFTTLQSPDGAMVALASETGSIYVYDVTTSTLVVSYASHAMGVRSLAWSADSQVGQS